MLVLIMAFPVGFGMRQKFIPTSYVPVVQPATYGYVVHPEFSSVLTMEGSGTAIESHQAKKYPATTVFVGNIHEKCSNDLIKGILQECGSLANWKRIQDSDGNFQAFGFCEFHNPEHTLRAVRVLHGWPIGGKKLTVTVDDKTREFLRDFIESKRQLLAGKTPLKLSCEKNGLPYEEDMKNEDDAYIQVIYSLLKQNVPELTDTEGSTEREVPPRSAPTFKGKGGNLDVQSLDQEKKEFIAKEISHFRQIYKDDDKKRENVNKKRGKEQDEESSVKKGRSPSPVSKRTRSERDPGTHSPGPREDRKSRLARGRSERSRSRSKSRYRDTDRRERESQREKERRREGSRGHKNPDTKTYYPINRIHRIASTKTYYPKIPMLVEPDGPLDKPTLPFPTPATQEPEALLTDWLRSALASAATAASSGSAVSSDQHRGSQRGLGEPQRIKKDTEGDLQHFLQVWSDWGSQGNTPHPPTTNANVTTNPHPPANDLTSEYTQLIAPQASTMPPSSINPSLSKDQWASLSAIFSGGQPSGSVPAPPQTGVVSNGNRPARLEDQRSREPAVFNDPPDTVDQWVSLLATFSGGQSSGTTAGASSAGEGGHQNFPSTEDRLAMIEGQWRSEPATFNNPPLNKDQWSREPATFNNASVNKDQWSREPATLNNASVNKDQWSRLSATFNRGQSIRNFGAPSAGEGVYQSSSSNADYRPGVMEGRWSGEPAVFSGASAPGLGGGPQYDSQGVASTVRRFLNPVTFGNIF